MPDAARTAPASDQTAAGDLSSYLPPMISARVAAALRSRSTGATVYLPWAEP